jgi:hypothetical protein
MRISETTSRARAKTQLSTLDRASPALLLLNQNLYMWRTTSRVWYLDFHHEGGIYRAEWDFHRLTKVGLALGGGWPTRWSSLH